MADNPVADNPATASPATANLVTDPLLEADDNPNADADSAIAASIDSESYRTSLASSVVDYKYENGRRYHAFREGSYVLPNDEEEQDRMDLVHHIYKILLGGELHLAPLSKNVQRVLDLGTGTGIWALDFADQYPSAQVIGNDLSPIQPKWTAPNCQFEVDDYESDWSYSHPFDYIHGRELSGAVKDYDRLFAQAFQHLKSGGYLEMQSYKQEILCDDGTDEKAPYTRKCVEHLQEASKKFGKSMVEADTWKDRMIKAGFVDVTCRIFKIPIGTWPKDPKLKELGRWHQVAQEESMGPYCYALFSRVLGWQREAIEVLLAMVRKELRDPSIHQYVQIYIVYGRKP